MSHVCLVCGQPVVGERRRRTCSARCRVAQWRQVRATETAATIAQLKADNARLGQRVAALLQNASELELLVGQLKSRLRGGSERLLRAAEGAAGGLGDGGPLSPPRPARRRAFSVVLGGPYREGKDRDSVACDSLTRGLTPPSAQGLTANRLGPEAGIRTREQRKPPAALDAWPHRGVGGAWVHPCSDLVR
jgi:hypothetical protein